MQVNEIVGNLSVAKFYYKGSHSHPIRRTIVVIDSCPNYLRGYEIREGKTIRSIKEAPIKSYTKDKIATYMQLGGCKHRKPGPALTTLREIKLVEATQDGI